jgi:CheY-like chemotaxis protein
MHKMIKIWIVLLLTGWLNAGEFESYIIVAHGMQVDAIVDIRMQLERTVQSNKTLHSLLSKTHAKISTEHIDRMYAVQIGPFVPDKRFAMMYLSVRSVFPDAVVIERIKPSNHKPASGSVSSVSEHKVMAKPVLWQYTDTNSTAENPTIWIALFGLAIIGILYMFLSSDQLRRIKKEHAYIAKRQKNLEVKQHTVLAQMGQNIHALAQETATRTQTLVEKTEGNLLRDDVQKMIDGENELLGITSDLIKFLQIKSKKVAIQNAPFDFNNVLHEVAGTLYSTCRESDKELVFDIDNLVPKTMHADSLHMVQVLTNLIEYVMCHTQSHEVRLHANIQPGSDGIQILQVQIDSDIGAIDEEMFFDAYYDEDSKKYIGLGLFVARELVQLMGGKLQLDGEKMSHTRMVLTFPVGERSKDRRQYRLPDKAIMDEKVLIVDRNPDVGSALKHFLEYFKMDATVISPESFKTNVPDLSRYDIVAIDNTLLDMHVLELLQRNRAKLPLQVISLENLYASQTVSVEGVADVRMKKPLTQQHVFDVLVQLRSRESVETQQEEGKREDYLDGGLEIYRGNFDDNRSIALENFSRFSGAHVMVVEDNIVNQKVLNEMLSKAGVDLTFANNGQEAIDQLDKISETIDMILMDISMPIMDGFVATRRIREDERFRSIPIVTLTALVSEHEVDKMFDAGANGYLSKPLKIGRLFSAMERFLPTTDALHTFTNPSSSSHIASSVDGFDFRLAIDSMQGNDLLYREVLSEFKEFYGNSDILFETLIRELHYDQLKTLCGDLRGLSGSIGAKGLFNVVTRTLNLLAQDQHGQLYGMIEPYHLELAKLNNAIEKYLW